MFYLSWPPKMTLILVGGSSQLRIGPSFSKPGRLETRKKGTYKPPRDHETTNRCNETVDMNLIVELAFGT